VGAHTDQFLLPVSTATVPELIGRERELSLLEALLDGVHERGRALLLRGEAGIGKSSLLTATSERARRQGFQVLRTAGVQWEAHLPFACLHQLLRPVLDRVEDLPSPQRTAMQAAFGMSDAAAPEFFFIALAVLDLLADAAAQAPLLLIIEDAQWLDAPTRDVLMFVARRVESEPTIVLAAARVLPQNDYADSGFPELLIEPLDPAAAEAVLDAQAPGLAPSLRERVLADASGNPLALVELPTVLPADVVDGAALPEVLPLTKRLERAFAARVSELPEVTRTILVAVATDDGDAQLSEVLAVASAVSRTDATVDAVEPAVIARLVETDNVRIRFRHPLVRSAIHQAAGRGHRRALHAAWAQVLDDQQDRRVGHLAASLAQPDEEVAAALEEVAARARRRGAIRMAITALEQAAGLTPDSTRQAGRLISAAELAFEVGGQDTVNRLLARTQRLELGPHERSRVACLQGVFDDGVPGDSEGIRGLLDLAEWARTSGDLDLTLQLLVGAARRCWFGDPGPQTRAAVIAAGERLDGVDPLDPRLLGVLAIPDPLKHNAMVLDRLAKGQRKHGNLAHGDVPDGPDDDFPDGSILVHRALCAYVVGDFVTVEQSTAGAIPHLREQGRLSLLAQALVTQSLAATYRGNWVVARAASEEAGRLATETNQPVWAASAKMAEALVTGLRGERDVTGQLAAVSEWATRPSRPVPYDAILGAVRAASGLVALADGRPEVAYEHLRTVLDPNDPAYHHMQRAWIIGFLAEAALHSGRVDEGRATLATLEWTLPGLPAPMLQLGMGYARAVLAGDDQADALFQRALADPQLPLWPFQRARLNLAYGAWLRRQRRVADSREPLRAARDIFDSLGGGNWSERARQELRATGESSHLRTPGIGDLLSPQELQIAQMAADGLSNREIGQRLYLSHRTVGSHLYRIFPKLEVTSRGQLKAALEVANAPKAP
jgi:DNA-binding CsgD family transcriptional regulator